MSEEAKINTITIEGKDYAIDSLSDRAKEQIASIQFVDARVQQLQNEWAVSDTARIGYTNAIKNEFKAK